MKNFRLINVLFKIKLLTPISIYRLSVAFFKNGINLMTLLHFAGKKYPQHVALVDDDGTLTYKELLEQSMRTAYALKEKVSFQSGQKVGFFCSNHASLVKGIFAVSRLGGDIYLLNPEMSENQLHDMEKRYHFDLLIYDGEKSSLVEPLKCKKLVSYHDSLPAINNHLHIEFSEAQTLPKTSAGQIVLQTSGTTGIPKNAAHKPSLFNYLNPFVAFIQRLKILNYHTAHIATPIYHGYGIAVLLLFIPLGKKLVITKKFDPKKACALIYEHHVEMITVVPLMLPKMLQTNVNQLGSLSCIASGGAKLSPKLIEQTFRDLGHVLYNLYGTSEAGLNFIATPEDLAYSPGTVGQKIQGMQLKILDRNMNQVEKGKVGQFCIKNDWSISTKKSPWIQTGDLGYQDKNRYYFLCGRVDDMIISGGENVYPLEVEQVLYGHPQIEDAAVIGIDDELFGQRLKAFILLVEGASFSEEQLSQWLSSKLARYQQPKDIKIVDRLPYTTLGKLDRTRLKSW